MSRLTTYLNKMFKHTTCTAIWVEEYYENSYEGSVIEYLSDKECRVKECTDCSWQINNIKEIIDELSEPME